MDTSNKTRRLNPTQLTKSSPLPSDYLKMVTELFTTHYDAELKKMGPEAENEPEDVKVKGVPARFYVSGAIYPDEIVLSVSLFRPGLLAASSVYASSDFDPKASAPTVQDLLGLCVDAVGSIFDSFFSGEQTGGFEWTVLSIDQNKVYVMMDKANPVLEGLADHWLEKNDPNRAARLAEEEEETKKLFVTGPSSEKKKH